MRAGIALALLLLAGCEAAGVYVPGPCAFEAGPMVVDGCDLPERRRAHWRRNIPRVLQVFDERLAALSLPPMTPAASGYAVLIKKRHDEPHGGLYESSRGRIILWPSNPSAHWWTTPLTHELWHLYEHEVFGLSDYEWRAMQSEAPPRHFMVGAWSGIHSQVRDEVLARDWGDE